MRQMSVSGSFYPDKKEQILEYFKHFESYFLEQKQRNLQKPKAIIVPHAGYIYSGFTAFCAYYSLLNGYKKVAVIAPSHKVYFQGISGAKFSSYETPFGNLEFSDEIFSKLKSENLISEFYEAHKNEHSSEVQFPFIKHFLNLPTLEIIYGDIDFLALSKVLKILLDFQDTLIIISTDLSHFYPQDKANELDLETIKNIEEQNIKALLSQKCEACGKLGVLALLEAIKKQNLSIQGLDYRTSFDMSHDDKSVVGYYSGLVL